MAVSSECQIRRWPEFRLYDVGMTPAANRALSRQDRFDVFLAAQPKSPTSKAEKEQLYRSFLEWSKQQSSQ